MSTIARLASALMPLFIVLHSASAADVVKLAADEWCPYNCAPDGDRQGYIVEIAREALKPAGLTVEYSTMPWKRALLDVREGRLNGALGAQVGEAEGLFPQEPLGAGRNILAMLPDRAAAFTWTGIDSLKALRLGGAQGYAYDQGPIDAYIAGAGKAVELLSGTEIQSQNLRKLLAGRVDAVIEDENVMRMTISEMQPKPDVRMVAIGEAAFISVAFSAAIPDSKKHVELIDDYIVKARADGRLRTLLAKYGLEDWKR